MCLNSAQLEIALVLEAAAARAELDMQSSAVKVGEAL